MLQAWFQTAALVASCLPAQAGLVADEGSQSLEKLLSTPVEVASSRLMPSRVSPGVITLITREEIRASGARDLMDVMRLVPGFEFASDSQGAVGLGFRSTFGHQGKVLLLWDGQEMNEPSYGTTQFGAHYPLEEVERIEILRGPGSVIYGGFAELAVIKVSTRRGTDLAGPAGSLWLSSMGGGLNRMGSVAYGQAHGDLECSLSYTGGLGSRGVGDWPLPEGPSLSLSNPSLGRLSTDFLNLGLSKGDLRLRYIRDLYTVSDFTQEVLPGNPAMTFRGDFLEAAYQWHLSPAWTLAPRLGLKRQSPWYYPAIGTLETTRTMAGLNAFWEARPDLNLLLGFEHTRDRADQYRRPPTRPITTSYAYDNQALLFQASWMPGGLTLDLGARLDEHSQFGSNLSPRLALAHMESDWHVKVLASGSFRAPAIAELRDNPRLQAEHTRTYELELGWRVSTASYLTANLFWLSIHEPISYVILGDGSDSFANFDRTGSRGLELDLQTRWSRGWIRAGLALATAQDKDAFFYQVQASHRFHVGLPNLKGTLQGQLPLGAHWTLNPSLIALGQRYGYRPGDTQATRFDPTALANLWLHWTPGGTKVALGLGVNNLLGADNLFIQGYGVPGTGGNPPLPGPGREIAFRLSYNH